MHLLERSSYAPPRGGAVGEGASETERTLFIVGDEKQSIYSFQGAEPARFMEEGDRLAAAAAAAELGFERPGLDVSFRSAPEILAGKQRYGRLSSTLGGSRSFFAERFAAATRPRTRRRSRPGHGGARTRTM